jgi:hypothetical protein
LHLDFVAKPEGGRPAWNGLEAALSAAELWREGLESSILLVSDREARLVTLLTFWDAGRFLAARESRIAWMQKVLAPFADGSVRAHTSVPQVLARETRSLEVVEKAGRANDAAIAAMVG